MLPDLWWKSNVVVMLDKIILEMEAVAFLEKVVVLDRSGPRVQVQIIACPHSDTRVLNRGYYAR